MLRNGHVRFGGRAAETHRPRGWQGAAVRPYSSALTTYSSGPRSCPSQMRP